MTDRFTESKRSRIMSRVRSKNTTTEKLVRSILHKMGYRFRLHVKNLPGKPDIVLPRFRKIIFVNGCFWHGHPDCKRATRPATNVEFWNKKIDGNIERDNKISRDLMKLGWQVLVIWQCQTKDVKSLMQRLTGFLKGNK